MTEKETQIDLFVFWRHHDGEVHTFCGGRSDKIRDDGKCRVPSYGQTWWIAPVFVLPVTVGEMVLSSIKNEEMNLRNELKNAREAASARIKNLITFPKIGFDEIKNIVSEDCKEAERGWADLCNELGLIDSVSIDKLIERIRELKHEIHSANETLAKYCSEVDPGRCSLDSTIQILIAEVLRPSLKRRRRFNLY